MEMIYHPFKMISYYEFNVRVSMAFLLIVPAEIRGYSYELYVFSKLYLTIEFRFKKRIQMG